MQIQTDLLAPPFERLKKNLVHIFREYFQRVQSGEACDGFFRNSSAYEKEISDFVRLARLRPKESIKFLLSKKDDPFISAGTGPSPLDSRQSKCYCALLSLLYFSDCLAQILTYVSDEDSVSLETDLQRLWNVCQVSIATEDVDGNDLKMTVMKQMSVVFGLLSHFMLARVLQCFEALLDQRSKQKQEKRFVYILYRFVRLRVVENDPNCLTYIMSYLKLVADMGEESSKDNDVMACWLELANNTIAQLNFLAHKSEVAAALERITNVCEREVRSSNSPEAVRLMATISCRLGKESYTKFLKEYLFKKKLLERSDMHKAILTAFLTIMRGTNMSRGNMFWEWGQWNYLKKPMVEVTWINDSKQYQNREDSFTDMFLKYLIDFREDPKLTCDILVNLCVRDPSHFLNTTVPTFVNHFMAKQPKEKLRDDIEAIFPVFECVRLLMDPDNGVAVWLDVSGIGTGNVSMDDLGHSKTLCDSLKNGIVKRLSFRGRAQCAFCFRTTESRERPVFSLPIQFQTLSEAAQSRFKKADELTALLFEIQKQKYFDAPNVLILNRRFVQLSKDEKLDIKLLSYLAILSGREQKEFCKELANVLICGKPVIAFYAGRWLNYIYVNVKDSRIGIITELLVKSASSPDINCTFILLDVVARLLDLNLDLDGDLPAKVVPYLLVALANPARENRDLALNIIERLRLMKKAASGDQCDYLPFNSAELAAKIQEQARLRFMMNCSDVFEFQEYRKAPFVPLRVAADSNSLIVWECYLAEIVKSMRFHIPPGDFFTAQNMAFVLATTLAGDANKDQNKVKWVKLLCVLGLSCSICTSGRLDGVDAYGNPHVRYLVLPAMKEAVGKIDAMIIDFLIRHLSDKLGFQYVRVSCFDIALNRLKSIIVVDDPDNIERWIDACRGAYHLIMCSDLNVVMTPNVCRDIIAILESMKRYISKFPLITSRKPGEELQKKEKRVVKYFASIIGFFAKAITKETTIQNEGDLVWSIDTTDGREWPKQLRQEYLKHLANYAHSLSSSDVSYQSSNRLAVTCMQAICELVSYGPILEEKEDAVAMEEYIEKLVLEMEISGIPILYPLLYHHLTSLLGIYIEYAYWASPLVSKGFFNALARLFFVGDPQKPGLVSPVPKAEFESVDVENTQSLLSVYNEKLICVSLIYLIDEDHFTTCNAFQMLTRLLKLYVSSDKETQLKDDLSKISSIFFSVILANNEHTVLDFADIIANHCEPLVVPIIRTYLDVLQRASGKDSYTDDTRKQMMLHILKRLLPVAGDKIPSESLFRDLVQIHRTSPLLFSHLMGLIVPSKESIRILIGRVYVPAEENVVKMLGWLASKLVRKNQKGMEELGSFLVEELSQEFSFQTWKRRFRNCVQEASRQVKEFCSISLAMLTVLNEVAQSLTDKKLEYLEMFYRIMTACLVMLDDQNKADHICELLFTILSKRRIQSLGDLLVPDRLVFWDPTYADTVNPVSVDYFVTEFQKHLRSGDNDYEQEMEIWGKYLLEWACDCRRTEVATKAARIYLYVRTNFDDHVLPAFFKRLSIVAQDLNVPTEQDYVVAALKIFFEMIDRIEEPSKTLIFRLAIVFLDIDHDVIRQLSLNIITKYLRNFPREKNKDIETELNKILCKLGTILMKDGCEHSSYAVILAILEQEVSVHQVILMLLPTLYSILASVHLVAPFASEIPMGECKLMMEMLKYLASLSCVPPHVRAVFNECATSPRDKHERYFADTIFRDLLDESKPKEFVDIAEIYAGMIEAGDVDHKRTVFVIAERCVNTFRDQAHFFSPVAVLAAKEEIPEAWSFLELFIADVGTKVVCEARKKDDAMRVDLQIKGILRQCWSDLPGCLDLSDLSRSGSLVRRTEDKS